MSEPDRGREIEELAEKCRKGSVLVGLFDHSTATFFKASMIECAAANSGPISSPDARHTPTYYSERKLPAWFRFASIENVSPDEFETLFGPPPSGDGTFFPIWRERRRPDIGAVELISTKRTSILHLSDIHFGVDFGFPKSEGPGKIPLLEILDRNLRDDPPGLIVVSGDITSRADVSILQDQGLRFLNDLARVLKVPKECFVIVPGNHDIALQSYTATDYSHETAFNLFVKEFYGRPMKCPEVRRFELGNKRTIELLAINSVRLRHTSEKQFGYVQWRLYEDKLRSSKRNPEDFRVAVLHHHLVPASREESLDPNYPEAAVSLTLDAGAVVEGLQANGYHLTLHGHQHVPAITRIDRGAPVDGNVKLSENGGLVVVAAGSAGTKRLSDEMRDNSYNIIRVLPKGYSVEAKYFNPSRAPQTLYRAAFDSA